ncbi:DUF433 domain-containing protein [Nocardia inohanensis]|uniref:DUF433 domain-containing protein n=1 Tax=Nocardia inohanensis TaxID=209246 RepID=UPI000830DF2A|nr:DUF433 domain-containing protein [Nocardia inohanensis]
MAYLDRITQDPTICHGVPVLRGRRFPVDLLLGLLAAGIPPAEILADHPELEREDLVAVLEYATLDTADGRRALAPAPALRHPGMHSGCLHPHRRLRVSAAIPSVTTPA